MGTVRTGRVKSLLIALQRLHTTPSFPKYSSSAATNCMQNSFLGTTDSFSFFNHLPYKHARPLTFYLKGSRRLSGVYGTEGLRWCSTRSPKEQHERYKQGQAGGKGKRTQSRKEESRRVHEGNVEEQMTLALQSAMAHVTKVGWMEAALVAGARDAGLSPAIVGAFPRKDAALVEYFMDECNHRLQDEIEAREEDLSSMLLANRIASIVRLRLEMQAPYVSKWAQALSIQANPMNLSRALKQRALLMDDIWHGAGDLSTDMDWYAKRAFLGAIYTATELYMLTDFTPGFRDSWIFLERRINDAFEYRKAIQEASQVARAVSMGLRNTLQSIFNKRGARPTSPKF